MLSDYSHLSPETRRLIRRLRWQEALTTFFGFLGAIILFLAALMVRGFCLSVLWGWLIVPVFGLPAISIAAALGLTLFLNYLLRDLKQSGTLWSVFSEGAIILTLGYLTHLFI